MGRAGSGAHGKRHAAARNTERGCALFAAGFSIPGEQRHAHDRDRRPPAAGGSLRGMAAEFFPAPAERGGRVLSCVSGAAACAQDSARRFWGARGWPAVGQETVGGRNYLADVLCTRR